MAVEEPAGPCLFLGGNGRDVENGSAWNAGTGEERFEIACRVSSGALFEQRVERYASLYA
jgi:hypothetical protein